MCEEPERGQTSPMQDSPSSCKAQESPPTGNHPSCDGPLAADRSTQILWVTRIPRVSPGMQQCRDPEGSETGAGQKTRLF